MTLLLSSTSTVISQYYNIQVSYTTPRTSDFIYSCNLYPFPHMSRKCKHNSRSIPASTLRGCTSVVFWLKVQWNTLQTRTNLFRFPLSATVSFVAAVFVISRNIYIYINWALFLPGDLLFCVVFLLSLLLGCADETADLFTGPVPEVSNPISSKDTAVSDVLDWHLAFVLLSGEY